MGKNNKSVLTAAEKEVMEILWNSDIPLTSKEIVDLSVDKNWKPSYIHLIINSLLKKEYIKVETFKQTTKNYARAFVPIMTKESIYVKDILKDISYTDDQLISLIKELINAASTPETLKTISDYCNERIKSI